MSKVTKTWVAKHDNITFEIRERRDKNVLHYEGAFWNKDGKEIVKDGFTSYEQARRWMKKYWRATNRFKVKRAPRKKVNAVKVEYDGHEFDSMTERDFFIYLLNLKIVSEIELQKTFHLLDGYEIPSIVNKKGSRTVRKKVYTPDFVCEIVGQGKVAFEVKGSVKSIPRDLSLRRHLFESKYGIQLVIAVPDKKEGWKFS